MSTRANPLALDRHGRHVTIDMVPSGRNSTLRCPSCDEKLIAKRGESVVHHFAHKSQSQCVGRPKSEIHIKAQEILVTRLKRGERISIRRKHTCECQTVDVVLDGHQNSELEVLYTDPNGAKRIADVALLFEERMAHQHLASHAFLHVIEVFHSNKTEEGAREGVLWSEVAAVDVVAQERGEHMCLTDLRRPAGSCASCAEKMALVEITHKQQCELYAEIKNQSFLSSQ